MGARAAALRLAAAAASIHCVNVDAFVCADDGDCRRGEQPGLCEASQHCSYADATCPSGRRYSDLAGSLANDCTSVDDSSSSSSSSSSSEASSSSSSTSSTAESSTGAVPVCGDNTQDDGEECDDGNDIDGDGCNADCVRSGALLWSWPVPGSAGEDDAGQAITMLASGGVAVAGWLHTAFTGRDVWVARFSPDGQGAWSRVYGLGDDDRGYGITQGNNADLFVGGSMEDSGGRRAWVGILSPDGDPIDDVTLVGSEVRAVSAFATRVVAVGRFSGGAFVEALQPNGASVWRVEGDATSDQLFAVHTTATEAAWVAGRKANDAWLAQATPMGITTIDMRDGSFSETDWAQAVLAVGDRVVTAGLLISDLAGDIWVAGYDAQVVGPPLWEYERCTKGTSVQEEAEALAVEPSGDLIVAGFTTLDDRDAWIARLTVDGDCVWERSYAELEEDSTARGVAVGPDGRIYVTGEITGADGSLDAWVAAFAP